MKTYKCQKCGKGFRFAKQPDFCPFCGGHDVSQDNEKARNTALEIIRELDVLALEMETLWSEYAEKWVVYEDKMQTLRVYKRRGIVTEDEMPTIQKKSLANELNAYRKAKKEGATS